MIRPLLILLVAVATFLVKCDAADFNTLPDFYAQKYAQVTAPRGLLRDPKSDAILVLSQAPVSSIISLKETDNGDGTVRVHQKVLVNGSTLNLTHGLAYSNNYLYASSATTVYRWLYPTEGGPEPKSQVVIHSIPYTSESLHITRSLTFDSSPRLYVSIGSHDNLDPDSGRARIKRFSVTKVPMNGYDFNVDGEIFADGLRNAVGLDFDSKGVLWAVDNGADDLFRQDLGGDIHENNPADELNKLEEVTSIHFGYPYCFTSGEALSQGKPVGTQFSWPNFTNDGTHTDAWCQDVENNRRPALPLKAHHAPLGLQFYRGEGCEVAGSGAFPCTAVGDAFTAYHGSTDSDQKVGYRVGWLPFDKASGSPKGPEVSILFEPELAKCSPCLRPVNAIFNKNGHLIVSADASDEIFRLTYKVVPTRIGNGAAGVGVSGGIFVTWAYMAVAGFLWRFL